MKIWRDRLRCDRYFHCYEKTMVVSLPLRPANENESHAEATEVSA